MALGLINTVFYRNQVSQLILKRSNNCPEFEFDGYKGGFVLSVQRFVVHLGLGILK